MFGVQSIASSRIYRMQPSAGDGYLVQILRQRNRSRARENETWAVMADLTAEGNSGGDEHEVWAVVVQQWRF
ncbi:ATP-dependent DNA-helicase RecQ [Sesbania bispinosa]|nr:ATP-dependent DNA-helicase RecQ [Sesbania bispinosa]